MTASDEETNRLLVRYYSILVQSEQLQAERYPSSVLPIRRAGGTLEPTLGKGKIMGIAMRQWARRRMYHGNGGVKAAFAGSGPHSRLANLRGRICGNIGPVRRLGMEGRW